MVPRVESTNISIFDQNVKSLRLILTELQENINNNETFILPSICPFSNY